jgi:hypothetical protein
MSSVSWRRSKNRDPTESRLSQKSITAWFAMICYTNMADLKEGIFLSQASPFLLHRFCFNGGQKTGIDYGLFFNLSSQFLTQDTPAYCPSQSTWVVRGIHPLNFPPFCVIVKKVAKNIDTVILCSRSLLILFYCLQPKFIIWNYILSFESC